MVRFGTSLRSVGNKRFHGFGVADALISVWKLWIWDHIILKPLIKLFTTYLTLFLFFLTTTVKGLGIGSHPVELPNKNLSGKRADKNQQLITSIQRLFNRKLTRETRQFIANLSTNLRNKFNQHSKTWKSYFKSRISQIKLQIKSYFFWNEISYFKKKNLISRKNS